MTDESEDKGVRHYKKNIRKKDYDYFVLGGDIGGTNSNFGISGVKKNNNVSLLFSIHFKSKKLKSIVPAVKDILFLAENEYGIEIEHACFGVAGPVSQRNDYSKLTNLPWAIDAKELLRKTDLKTAIIINDFQAIGFGVNQLSLKKKNDIFRVKHEKHSHKGLKKTTKAIIGAGTGLGKSILVFDDDINAYFPIQSEGGHSDFPAQNDFEIQLIDFIRKKNRMKKDENVTYEDIISGRGLLHIYNFLKDKKKFKSSIYSKKIEKKGKDTAELISLYKNKDQKSKETFRLFSKFYGRCAKNFVLDTLARGGLFIAGGIAAKNKDIFKSEDFINEFENSRDYKKILKDVPIYVITNYNISLLGASFAAMQSKVFF